MKVYLKLKRNNLGELVEDENGPCAVVVDQALGVHPQIASWAREQLPDLNDGLASGVAYIERVEGEALAWGDLAECFISGRGDRFTILKTRVAWLQRQPQAFLNRVAAAALRAIRAESITETEAGN